MKVASLRQAANYFDYLGMQEMQLWSEFYAAYYLLGVLNDANAAAADARNIEAAATRSGFKMLVLAATGLQGSAALAQAVGSSGNTSRKNFEQAQALFTKTAELAQSLDLQYERAHAIYQRGIAYEQPGNQRGVVTVRNGDVLRRHRATGICQLRTQTHCGPDGIAGNNAGAIALMQEISAAAPVEAPPSRAEAKPEETAEEEPAEVLPQGEVRATREMASYLFEQGRLQEKTFRHLEAVATLRQAEALNEKSPSVALTGPLSMLLGKALYGAGQPDTALQMLRQGIAKTPAARFRNQLEAAHGLVATIERERGDFDAMKAARDAQGMFITEPRDRAALVFAQALDTVASQGTGSSLARSLLQQAESLARANGPASVWQLATLELCSLDAQACSVDAARQALASLQASALPEAAFQARWLWIQILRRTGQPGPAQTGLDRLIEDMRFYQAHLPGVLGSWYSNTHEDVFSSAMDMVLSRAGADAAAGPDSAAVQALAELGRLSAFDHRQKVSAAEEAEANQLRSLFAGRVEAQTNEAAASIDREAQGLLQQLRSQQAESGSSLRSRSQSLASHLALDRNTVLISYYLARQA
jgi:tetratricopeptide (TPR) repeat protein